MDRGASVAFLPMVAVHGQASKTFLSVFVLGPRNTRPSTVDVFVGILVEGLQLVKDRLAIGGKVLFRYGDEFDNTSVGRDVERFAHERLDQGSVAFVGRGLKL